VGNFGQVTKIPHRPNPASTFDVWNFQPTISAWVEENKQLPIFYQPPGLVKSEQIPILPRHQSHVSDWLSKFRTDSDFTKAPESRQHFDVWRQGYNVIEPL
jgi:hypothetical protein